MSEAFEFEQGGELDGQIEKFEEILRSGRLRFFDVEELQSIIDYYLQTAQMAKAEKAIELGMEQHPAAVELMVKKALVLSRKNEFSKALEILDNVELLEGSNPEVYIYKAEIYSELQDHDQAIRNFLAAIELVDLEEHDYIYIDIAAEYQNKGDLDRARFYLKKAIHLNPYNDIGYLEFLFTMQMEEKVEDALAFFETIVNKDPYNQIAWYYVGLAYQDMELYEKAIDAYDFATVIKEDFPEAWIQKSECYIQLDLYRNAIPALKQALQFTEYNARVFYTLGECYENLEEYETAIGYYRKSAELYPEMGDSWLGIGICLGELGRMREGFNYVRKAVRLEPNNTDFLLVYAEFLRDLSQFGEAEEVYERVQEMYPDSCDLWLDYSALYFKMDDPQRAIETIMQGIKHLPGEVEFQYRLAGYQYYMGHVQEARHILDAALDIDFEKHADFLSFFSDLAKDPHVIELIESHRINGH